MKRILCALVMAMAWSLALPLLLVFNLAERLRRRTFLHH